MVKIYKDRNDGIVMSLWSKCLGVRLNSNSRRRSLEDEIFINEWNYL